MAVSIRRGLFWMSASQSLLFVTQFGGSVAIARLLSPYEMGVYAIAAAVVGVLATIRAFGLGSFLIRERELDTEVLTTVFTINTLLAILSSATILGASGIAGRSLGDQGVTNVMLLLAIAPFINIFEFLPSACLERQGAFRVVAVITTLKSLINTGVTLLLAFNGASYMSIAWGNIATAICGAIFYNILGRPHVSLRLGLQDWRRVGRFGLQMLTISAVGSVAGKLSDFLIGRLIGLAALGLYSRAAGLNGLLWDNLHLVIARVVFVDFAEQHRQGMSLRETYLRIVAMLTAFLWPAFAGLAILSGPIVYTIYGAEWSGAALPLSILSVAGMFYVAITMTSEVFVVCGETKLQLQYEMKRTIISMVSVTIGCLLGLVWVAASRVVDAVCTIALVNKNLKRMTGTTSSDYPKIYLQSAILTLLACAPVLALMAFNSWSEKTSVLHITLAVALGVSGWMCGLWLAHHPLHVEIQRLATSAYLVTRRVARQPK